MTAPTLSLCMIVKNEEHCIRAALESVKDLVDEVVIMDTGSTDKTIDIAREYAVKIFKIEWKDDFALARNASLSFATCDWVLVLDADEVIDQKDCQLIREWIAQPTADIASLIQTTYSYESQLLMWKRNDLEGEESSGYPGYIPVALSRLFRRSPNHLFVGPVHEQLVNVKDPSAPVAALSVRLHHYGQVMGQRSIEKRQLYWKLGEKKWMLSPDNPKSLYEYAVASWEVGEKQKAMELFEKVIEKLPRHVESLCALASLYEEIERSDDAMALYKRALQVRAGFPGAIVPLANFEMQKNNWSAALHYLESSQQSYPDHPRVLRRIAQCYFGMGLGELAVSYMSRAIAALPQHLPLYMERAKMLLQMGREGDAQSAFKAIYEHTGRSEELKKSIVNIYADCEAKLPPMWSRGRELM